MQFKDVDPVILLRCAEMCDGHSIFNPQDFIREGLPKELVAKYTKLHESGVGHKETIFGPNGEYRDCAGLYGLELLRGIASEFGFDYWIVTGRGFQAQLIQEMLFRHFKLTPADIQKEGRDLDL
jgi:hypothetical protein